MTEEFDCRTCGACCVCFGYQKAYCDMTEELFELDELERFTEGKD